MLRCKVSVPAVRPSETHAVNLVAMKLAASLGSGVQKYNTHDRTSHPHVAAREADRAVQLCRRKGPSGIADEGSLPELNHYDRKNGS